MQEVDEGEILFDRLFRTEQAALATAQELVRSFLYEDADGPQVEFGPSPYDDQDGSLYWVDGEFEVIVQPRELLS